MKTAALLPLAIAVPLAAQPVVAPSPETVGRSRGQDAGSYNIVHSFETGYRFHTVGGNETRYRSDVNFGNGVRLLGSNLLVNSKEGHGPLFDEIVLNTQGLGNDPYQFANLRIQRNRLYRYDLIWRSTEYVNPGLVGLGVGHLLDTRRLAQDHDITLLPQSPLKFFFGYSRNSQDGAGLSSIQLFDSRGDEFPLFAVIDRRQREFRAGAELRLFGLRVTLHRGWQRFNEQAPLSLGSPAAGANPDDLTALSSFRRVEPYSGATPWWRGSLFGERSNRFSIGARFSYAGGRRDFALDESAGGANRFGAALTRQVLVAGSGRRPQSSGALTLSLQPNPRVAITNHTAFHQLIMDGDISYRELNNSLQTVSNLQFQTLSIRTVVNSTDASLRVAPWLGLFGGYHYSTRRIRSIEGFSAGAFSDALSAQQTNRVHSGLAGLRIQPPSPFSLTLDAEISRADRPFFPVSDRDQHALSARARYKTRAVTLTASARTRYNNNSDSLFTHSARSRDFTADATWTPNRAFALDAGYANLHLDTRSWLAYFSRLELVEGDRSLYTSEIHTASLGLRFSIRERTSLYAGYSRVQDTARSFPLTYQSPQARLSVRLHEKLRWNLGYQHYHYREDSPAPCLLAQVIGLPLSDPSGGRSSCPFSGNYRAHTGFSSVIWSF